jgi:hypothetical protein
LTIVVRLGLFGEEKAMGIASHFNRILHSELDIYAAWLPITNAFELGDYGVVSDGVFVKMGHIREFEVDFNRAPGAASSIDFKSEGTSLFRLVGDVQVDALPDSDIEAKLKIQFSHANSFLIKAVLSMEQMTNVHQVARQLNQTDGWRRKFRVISHIYTGNDCTIISSRAANSEITLSGIASMIKQLDLGKASADLSVTSTKDIGLEVVGKSGSVGLRMFKLGAFGGTRVLGPRDGIPLEDNWASELEDDV